MYRPVWGRFFVARKYGKDTSGGNPRKAELRSPAYVPKPKDDPGPENTYGEIYRNLPADPLGLLPGARKRK